MYLLTAPWLFRSDARVGAARSPASRASAFANGPLRLNRELPRGAERGGRCRTGAAPAGGGAGASRSPAPKTSQTAFVAAETPSDWRLLHRARRLSGAAVGKGQDVKRYRVTVDGRTYDVEIDDPRARPVTARVLGEVFRVEVETGGVPAAGRPGTAPSSRRPPAGRRRTLRRRHARGDRARSSSPRRSRASSPRSRPRPVKWSSAVTSC